MNIILWGIFVSDKVVTHKAVTQETMQYRVKVERLELVEESVYQVILRSADSQRLQWSAGQYLELVMPTGTPCAYSIASAPADDGMTLELHIQCYQDHERAREVIEHLQTAETVIIRLPNGNCHIGSCPDTALVLIAAGTGFAQMKAIIEQCLKVGHKHPLHLYWGARRPSGFYMPELPLTWAVEHKVQYHPVVSEPEADDDWNGRHGLLYKAVLDDCENFRDAHFYISGSPAMVYATLDELVAAGFPKEHIHSDVFDYCPR